MLTTIFSEGFETAFPGSAWTIVSSQGHGWDDNNTKAHTGAWSGFSADLANGTDQSTYVSNMDTTMTRTVDLSDYRDVSLSYWRFLNTELNFDTLQVTVSKAGVGQVQSTALSGSLQSWTQDTLQIPESLWGQSGVTVQFKFHSDTSVVTPAPSGVWIDDIVMDGFNDPGFPVSSITPPTGTNVRLNQFGEIFNTAGTIGAAAAVQTYGIGVDVAGSYAITVAGNNGLDPQVRIYDAAGNAIIPILDATGMNGTESITINRPTSGQAFYVRIGGYTTSTGGFTLSVVGPDSGVTTESVSSPTYSTNDTGSIDFAGDRDYYSITAPLDTNALSIALNNSANLDGVLTLFDASGQYLTQIDNGANGFTENLTNFAVTAGQTYVLEVSGYNMLEGSNGSESYGLTIDFNPDDVGNPPSKITVPSGTNLRLNQFGDISNVASSINSTLSYQTFGFGVETSGSYSISVTGPVDAQLRLYDSNGNAITSIQDTAFGGGTETLSANLTAGQTCYVVVGGFNTSTGNFTLNVDGPTASVPATAVAGPNYFVAASDSIFKAGDRDYFGVTAPAGTNVLSIILNPTATLDGVISLFDSTGNLLQQKDTFGSGGSETIANFGVTAGQSYVVMFSGYSLAEGSVSSESYSYSLDFGPDLVDINVAPTIPLGQNLIIAENSPTNTTVGSVVANDANSTAPNNVLTYQILSGSPSNPFSINSSTGLVTYVGPGTLNFENIPQYTLSVKVTDGGNLSATQQVVISVGDVNEAPSITPNQMLQVLENSPSNTVVGTVAADDPDTVAPNSTLTYSLVSGSPTNPFVIDSTTGQITVANPAALNFETTPQFTLQVKVTDGGNGNLNATQSVIVNLIDANDAPSIGAGQVFTVPENSAQGTSINTVVATDPDTTAPNKTLTYTITAGNTSTAFAINPTTGALTVNNPAVLDFEVTPSFSLTVMVTDGGNLTDSQTVVVNLTNVNEAPVIMGVPTGTPPTFVLKLKTPVSVFPAVSIKDPDSATDLGQINIVIGVPPKVKKNPDVISLGGASALGTVVNTVTNGQRHFTITLNPGVTSTQVENFLKGITFATKGAGLKTPRSFKVSVVDRQGASSNEVTQTVNSKSH